ncbi:MAG: alpha-1,2-fucosyltransferase [Bacteroidetes bacterium]|nr:alpha-1,2-fucosyltransferase [Bacteroidota bacterium]
MYVKAQYCRNAGLGNKLFPWARAVVLAENYGFTLIDPVWFSPRGAAITRGGIDYKKALNKIWLANNFKKRKKDASSLKSLLLHKNAFLQCDDIPAAIKNIQSGTNSNILFRWNTCHRFDDLAPYRKLVLNTLKSITINKSLSFVEPYSKKKFIGLNIRTGKDFVQRSSGKNGFYLTEMDWFISALRMIRENMGDLPAVIVSDGGKKELAAILQEPGTELVNSSNAIEDLLVLSNSTVLLGSGNSSFSAWASYLGAMDTYSSPETSFTHFGIRSEITAQVIGTLE